MRRSVVDRSLDFVMPLLLCLGAAAGTVLLTGGNSWAVETDWTITVRTQASNNIDRLPPGQEVKGEVFSTRLGMRQEEHYGRDVYLLEAYGGWEKATGTNDSRQGIYGLSTDITWDLHQETYLKLNAGTSRETTALDSLTDLDRTRALTKRRSATVTTGGKTPSGGSWEFAAGGESLDREDETTRTKQLDASSNIVLSRRAHLTLAGSALGGRNDPTGDDWDSERVAMGITSDYSRGSALGGEFFWSGSKTRFGGATDTYELNTVGMRLFNDSTPRPGISYHTEIGVDGTNIDRFGREWKPRILLSLRSRLGQATDINARASYSANVYRGADRTPEWARTVGAGAGIAWRAGRTVTFSSAADFRKDEFPASSAGAQRDQNEYSARAGISWQAAPGVSVTLDLMKDSVNSTLDTEDLDEDRLELAVTGII